MASKASSAKRSTSTSSAKSRAKSTAKPASAKKKPVARKTASKKTPATKAPAAKKASAKTAAKPAAKKAAVKKPAAKKAATRKASTKGAATGKAPAKKASTKKTPARKAPAGKAVSAPEKKVSRKKTVVNSVSAAAQRIEERRASRSKSSGTASRKTGVNGKRSAKPHTNGKSVLGKRDLKKFRELLIDLRERLVGDIQFLTTDNLHRMGRETGADLSGSSQHSADHGTDNFDREFALSLASSEQDILYEVDEALHRIDEGHYGICELSGIPIEKARLEVIPYTRFSVQAQTQMERGRARYRPFGQSFKGW